YWLDFEKPAFLWLLCGLPVFVWMSRRSLAGMGRGRRAVAVALRCGVAMILIAALAEPRVVRRTDDQTVIVVLDESSSVPPALRAEAWQFVEKAAATLRPEKDRIGVVRFGGDAVIDQMPAEALRPDRGPSPGRTR